MLHSEYLEEEAAKIAVSVMRECESKFDEIVACCFSVGDKTLYDQILANESMSENKSQLN